MGQLGRNKRETCIRFVVDIDYVLLEEDNSAQFPTLGTTYLNRHPLVPRTPPSPISPTHNPTINTSHPIHHHIHIPSLSTTHKYRPKAFSLSSSLLHPDAVEYASWREESGTRDVFRAGRGEVSYNAGSPLSSRGFCCSRLMGGFRFCFLSGQPAVLFLLDLTHLDGGIFAPFPTDIFAL